MWDELLVGDAIDPAVAPVVLAFAAARLANERLVAAISAALGIGTSDLRALSFVAAGDGITPKAVADHLGLTTGAMTTLLDRLEGGRLVERTPHPSDRRSLQVRTTARGGEVVDEVRRLYAAAFTEALGDSDPARVAADLEALAVSLERAGARLPAEL